MSRKGTTRALQGKCPHFVKLTACKIRKNKWLASDHEDTAILLCDFDRDKFIRDQDAKSKRNRRWVHCLKNGLLKGQHIFAGSEIDKVFDSIVGTNLVYIPGG